VVSVDAILVIAVVKQNRAHTILMNLLHDTLARGKWSGYAGPKQF
jgi:hypothetical protein